MIDSSIPALRTASLSRIHEMIGVT